MKKISLLSLIAIIAIVGAVGCNKDKENVNVDTNAKVANNQNVVGDKTVGSLKFTNTSLVYSEGGTNYTALLTNTSSDTLTVSGIEVLVYGEDGKLLGTMLCYIGGTIEPNATIQLSANHYADITSAVNIEYNIKN